MTRITELPNGHFDVQDENGATRLDEFGGPFQLRATAEAAQRMLNSFDTVNSQIQAINQRLSDVQARH